MKQTCTNHSNQFSVSNQILFVFYAIWVGIGIYYHEPWRDETHALMIASSSNSIFDLWHNIKYEGHPIGWYFVLWCGLKFYHYLLLLSVVQWFSALILGYLFIFKSPFSFLLKVLLVLGGLLGYEYGIISRNYHIPIALLFFSASIYQQRHQKKFLLLFILGLSAQFNVFATLLSIAFAATLFIEILYEKKYRIHYPTLAGFVFFGCSVLFFAATVYIKDDFSLIRETKTFDEKINMVVDYLATFPMMGLNFLYTDYEWRATSNINKLLIPVCLAVFFNALKNARYARVLFVSSILLITLFVFSVPYWVISNRHCGVLLVVVIVCAWIGYEKIDLDKNRYLQGWLYTAAIFHFYVGNYHLFKDILLPFSYGNETAGYIQSQPLLKNTLWAVYPGFSSSLFSAHLNRDVYQFQADEFGKYPTWKKSKSDSYYEMSGAMLRRKCDSLGRVYKKNVGLVLYDNADTAGLNTLPMAVFKGETVDRRGECFKIYFFKKEASFAAANNAQLLPN